MTKMFTLNMVLFTMAMIMWGLEVEGSALIVVLIITLGLVFMSNIHATVTLIRLELISMLMMIFLMMIFSYKSTPMVVLFMLFCVAVVDAVLGLAILSKMVRLFNAELLQLQL